MCTTKRLLMKGLMNLFLKLTKLRTFLIFFCRRYKVCSVLCGRYRVFSVLCGRGKVTSLPDPVVNKFLTLVKDDNVTL